jgi:hypothetical protein
MRNRNCIYRIAVSSSGRSFWFGLLGVWLLLEIGVGIDILSQNPDPAVGYLGSFLIFSIMVTLIYAFFVLILVLVRAMIRESHAPGPEHDLRHGFEMIPRTDDKPNILEGGGNEPGS